MPSLAGSLLYVALAVYGVKAVDVSWHAPTASEINNLDKVLSASGVYGFIFDSSNTPDKDYGQYNWCNMPHVRPREYKKPPREYKLQYVEVIHRHHKRTPYQSNTFPVESYPWNCDDESLFFYGKPLPGKRSAATYWKGSQSPSNPFKRPGFQGSCVFPQITRGGLDDSWQHGRDLFRVYHDVLHLLPGHLDPNRVSYRVTNNVITSQVAGMLINGMYGVVGNVPLIVEPSGVDSLEPSYSCPKSSSLFSMSKDKPGTTWEAHLSRTKDLFAALDSVSGVSPSDSGWHSSYDHYFDNLSARLCHDKPLPCSVKDSSKCISRTQADEVFRLGQFEYSYIYRDASTSLEASAASQGIWIAELAQHLRDQIAGRDGRMVYRHNVAHDGSISRVLSVMQLDKMVWPGMGAEIVYELYAKKVPQNGPANSPHSNATAKYPVYAGSNSTADHCDPTKKEYFVRVLFGGQVMRSSNPDLGVLDMIPASKLLGYFDALVGEKGKNVKTMCGLQSE